MKKVRKLSLNKETVRHLTNEELKGVAGGATQHTCANTCPNTCAVSCDGTCGPACNMSTPGHICQNTDGTSTCSGPTCP